MASIGHLAVGLALARLPAPGRPFLRALVLMGAAMLPDADFIGYIAGVPYASEYGHRGASHSLVFAVGVAAAAGLVAGWRWCLLIVAAVISHPLLDAATDGGRGVAVLWPLSDTRHCYGWRPIPVAPMGAAFFTARGAHVAAQELALFAPLFMIGLWPRTKRPGGKS